VDCIRKTQAGNTRVLNAAADRRAVCSVCSGFRYQADHNVIRQLMRPHNRCGGQSRLLVSVPEVIISSLDYPWSVSRALAPNEQ
jgi:hypothetical protein